MTGQQLRGWKCEGLRLLTLKAGEGGLSFSNPGEHHPHVAAEGALPKTEYPSHALDAHLVHPH